MDRQLRQTATVDVHEAICHWTAKWVQNPQWPPSMLQFFEHGTMFTKAAAKLSLLCVKKPSGAGVSDDAAAHAGRSAQEPLPPRLFPPFNDRLQYQKYFKTLLFEELRSCLAAALASIGPQKLAPAVVTESAAHTDSDALRVLTLDATRWASAAAKAQLGRLTHSDIVVVAPALPDIPVDQRLAAAFIGIVCDGADFSGSGRNQRRSARGGGGVVTGDPRKFGGNHSRNAAPGAGSRSKPALLRIAVLDTNFNIAKNAGDLSEAAALFRRGAGSSGGRPELWVARLDSLRPILPQFLALCGIQEHWCDGLRVNSKELIQARSREVRPMRERLAAHPLTLMCITEGYHELMRRRFNQQQLDAVLDCLLPRRVSLLQGPPGTGKSHTVLGMLGVFLHAGEYANSSMNSEIVFPTRKVLVVAPSNAAVDEVVLRILKNGLIGGDLQRHDPVVYRVGQRESMHPDVWAQCGAQAPILLEPDRYDVGANGHATSVSANAGRQRSRPRTVEAAEVVCATLSGCARSELVRFNGRFHACIVDEASQCGEPEAIVPLGLCKVKRLVLVGDPAQLPPTVVSPEAERSGLRISLMERLIHFCRGEGPSLNLGAAAAGGAEIDQSPASLGSDSPGAVPKTVISAVMNMHMLVVQHRMHPTIRTFPSDMFYDGLLQDAPKCKRQVRTTYRPRCPLHPLCSLACSVVPTSPSSLYFFFAAFSFYCSFLFPFCCRCRCPAVAVPADAVAPGVPAIHVPKHGSNGQRFLRAARKWQSQQQWWWWWSGRCWSWRQCCSHGDELQLNSQLRGSRSRVRDLLRPNALLPYFTGTSITEQRVRCKGA